MLRWQWPVTNQVTTAPDNHGRGATYSDAGMGDRVRQVREHGSRIITALERSWLAIQARHPEVPDVVIVTGAGSHQKGTPEGYRLCGHHWPPDLSGCSARIRLRA